MKNIFGNLVLIFMGETYFQEFGPKFLCVKHMFMILVQIFMGENYFQDVGPVLL